MFFFVFYFFVLRKKRNRRPWNLFFATINVSRDLTPVVFPIVALRFFIFLPRRRRFLLIDNIIFSFKRSLPLPNRTSASARNDLENGLAGKR